MGLFAPSPVVRLEFRSNSCEIERAPNSMKQSFDRRSFETSRSMTDGRDIAEKCWSWSLKNELFPQPQLQYMRDSLKPVVPFRQSFPARSSSRQRAVSRSPQRNSSPRLYLRTDGDELLSDTSIRTTSNESKRKSDVPSLVSDESRTSLDSSIESLVSPEQSPCRVSFSRPFINGTPPKFTNPCDKKQTSFEEADASPSRRYHRRARALISAGIDLQNHDVPESGKLIHCSFDFETKKSMARRSFDADTMFPKVMTPELLKQAVTQSAPASRSVSTHFPVCQDASKYIRRPLPAVPSTCSSAVGSPQRCAQRMRERRQTRSSSLPSPPTTPSRPKKSSYNLFPSPPRVTKRTTSVSPSKSIENSLPVIECIEDSQTESSVQPTSTLANISFSGATSPSSSFSSDAVARSYREMSTHLREIFLNDDISYALSLFPTPPRNAVE